MTLACALVLVLVGVWAYSNSLSGVFVFDDVGSISQNPNIKTLWPLRKAMSAPRDVTVAGRPIASLTLAFNYATSPPDARDALATPRADAPPDEVSAFRRNVWGYHALNLAVHLLAGLTLFGVVRRSLLAERLRERFGRRSTLLAFVIALTWLVHPVQTESVTYVVQRVESLMGLFFLLTLYCAIRASEDKSRAAWWTAAAVAGCALGMGSKEAMVVAPVVVALWDLLIGDPRPSPYRRHRLPLYGGLAATWLILIALVATNPRPHSAGFAVGDGWTWWSYLQTQASVVVHYLRLSVVPYPLVFDYAWEKAASFGEVAAPGALLIALVALTGFGIYRRHPIAFAGAWFFLILAPTSSFFPIATEPAAEHRLYLPVAAVIAVAVLGLYEIGLRLSARTATSGRSRPARASFVPGLALAAIVVAIFAGLTRDRNEVYASDEALMRDTVEKRPLNARARVAYGADLLAASRFAEAEIQLRAAIGPHAGDKAIAQAHMYLGSSLCAQGRIGEGVAHLEAALRADRSLTEVHALLGEAYAGQGNAVAAADHLARAAEALPDNAAILRRTAWLFATTPAEQVRNGAKAVQLAERATQLTGRQDLTALEALVAGYAEQDRFVEAAAAAREAIALAQAQGNMAYLAGLQRELALVEAHQKLRSAR